MVIVAVYVVFRARLYSGVKVTLRSAQVNLPGIGIIPLFKAKLVQVIVKGFIASEKVVVILLFIGTAVSPLAGFVEVTVSSTLALEVSVPPPLPHPAMKLTRSKSMGNPMRFLFRCVIFFLRAYEALTGSRLLCGR